MVMDYFNKKLAQIDSSELTETPDWVSNTNVSLNAWKYVELKKHEKIKYINSHSKRTQYLNKSSYQIIAAEVARAININRSTLMHHSTYSQAFTGYLNEVNAQLEAAMHRRLEARDKTRPRGSINTSKNDLVSANTELRARIAHLEALKTEELVKLAFDRLPLPVKRNLGLD